jgi:pilus assembly protein Flp/PilA
VFRCAFSLLSSNAATAVDYGLIAALVAVAIVTTIGTVGTNLVSAFNVIG